MSETDKTVQRWFVLLFEEEKAPVFYGEDDVRHRIELLEIEDIEFHPPDYSKGVQRFGSSAIHDYLRFPAAAASELRAQDLHRQAGDIFIKAEAGSKTPTRPLVCVPHHSLHEKRGQKRLLEMLEKEIARIEDDDRLSYPPAKVEINAPLALTQVELKALRTAYLKVKEWLKTET